MREPSQIVAGTKYGDAWEQADRRNPALTKPKPLVRTSGQREPTAPSNIFIPRLGKEMPMFEWFWREIREGGYLRRYVEREKGTSGLRLRRIARRMDGFRQNNKSDMRLKAVIPGREFFRWRRKDEDFWSDDSNLRSFKRDNPDACVYL